jgi:hypothetical protein
MVDEKRTDNFVLAEYAAPREEVKWIIGQIETLESTALIMQLGKPLVRPVKLEKL